MAHPSCAGGAIDKNAPMVLFGPLLSVSSNFERMYDFFFFGCAQILTRPYSLTFKTNHWQVLTNALWIRDLDHSSLTIFTVVEGNCGFLWSVMPQNEGFEPVISDYFHHGWRKFWILMIWNALKWRIWTIHPNGHFRKSWILSHVAPVVAGG